ncbi:MAG TPA: universal stress protein [Verrucomicrobiota bacterium]|nr:universal stress protein [Verrucomicrobiota bacterium]
MAKNEKRRVRTPGKGSVVPKQTEAIGKTVAGAILGGLVAGPVGAVAGAAAGALVEPGLKRGAKARGAGGGGEASARERSGGAGVEELKLRRILVPLVALKCAVPLARAFGARLDVLHVVEPMHFMAGLESVALAVSDEQVARSALNELKAVARREIPPGIEVEAMVRQGKPFDQITQAAAERGADLIVLTTHGFTGLKRAVMGSTAEAVVRHAPCSVWVVPARGEGSQS